MGKSVKVNNIAVGDGHHIVLISGPCVIEPEKTTYSIAKELKDITDRLGMPFIFKASYDKANRTNIGGYRGPGHKKGLAILEKLKKDLNISVTSDVHKEEEVELAGQVLDLVQIPACLFKQIDFVLAAGRTGKPINIKKGQFAAPWEVKNVVDQLKRENCEQVMVTERGTLFGYQTMVNDFRSIDILKSYNLPVIYDASHSVHAPSHLAEKNEANRNYIPTLCKAATAAGVDAIFLEVHTEPEKALSDSIGTFSLNELEPLLKDIMAIASVVRG